MPLPKLAIPEYEATLPVTGRVASYSGMANLGNGITIALL